MIKNGKRAIFGCLCALVFMTQAAVVWAENLYVSTMVHDAAFSLTYEGTSFELVNDALPLSLAEALTSLSLPSLDSQSAGFAYANTASNPFDPTQYAEATGLVFDDGGANGTAIANALSGPLVSSFSRALLYQPFRVTGSGIMTYDFDYNFFMTFSDPTPGGTAFGASNVYFALGLWDTDAKTFISYNSFSDSASGTDMDITLANFLTWEFADGQAGAIYAYADASAQVDAVPEPSTCILLGAGLAGLAVYRRRRNSAPTPN